MTTSTKTLSLRQAALPALAALAAATSLSEPAAARDPQVQFLIAEVQQATPQCRDFPEYGIVGRVSGATGWPSTTVSFTGCFPTYRSCEIWRGRVSGKIAGRIMYNACEPRW